MATRGEPAVAASSEWVDEEGTRLPAGEAHAWWPGRNQTLCGLALRRSRLLRFPHVAWSDALPESGGAADEVRRVCPKCRAAAGRKRSERRRRGTFPRP